MTKIFIYLYITHMTFRPNSRLRVWNRRYRTCNPMLIKYPCPKVVNLRGI